MIRKHKRFVRPKKAFEKSRIEEENKLVEQYGLKNKREIWKTIAKINYFRRRAKELAKLSNEEQEILFKKLQAKGLKVNSIADILALTVEDLLKRRLQTVVAQKKVANSVRHARQLIVHKKITLNGSVINIPSYIVSVSEEHSISLKPGKPKKAKIEEKAEEKVQEQPKEASQ
ncbi:MAG: 30S ribosomal protein S4 [Nanoarchaeota archaeon]